MKKLSFLLISAFIFFYSCTDNSIPKPPLDDQLLFGSWIDTTNLPIFINNSHIDTIYKYSIYNLNADGTFTLEGEAPYIMYDSGSWTVDTVKRILSFEENLPYEINNPKIKVKKLWEINYLDDNLLKVNFKMVRAQSTYTNQITGKIDTVKAIDLTRYREFHKIQ